MDPKSAGIPRGHANGPGEGFFPPPSDWKCPECGKFWRVGRPTVLGQDVAMDCWDCHPEKKPSWWTAFEQECERMEQAEKRPSWWTAFEQECKRMEQADG